jgi:hypothetical protein
VTQRKIHLFPPGQNRSPELGEKRIHESICRQPPTARKPHSPAPDAASTLVLTMIHGTK